ncbi:MAG: 30S ribosomal protein S6 [Bacteroidota bacterium]|nr:30S ribosomal protein S6 [Bacteroidota bacterium]
MSKKFYESYIIIDGNLEDAAIEEEIKKYETLLLKNDVEIVNIDRIGRKRLAYAIKKKLNGYYICFEILAPTGFITKVERSYILDENILRYLTIFVSPKTRLEKDEHFKHKALMQSKYEEAKEKQLIAQNEEAKKQEVTSQKEQEKIIPKASTEAVKEVLQSN